MALVACSRKYINIVAVRKHVAKTAVDDTGAVPLTRRFPDDLALSATALSLIARMDFCVMQDLQVQVELSQLAELLHASPFLHSGRVSVAWTGQGTLRQQE